MNQDDDVVKILSHLVQEEVREEHLEQLCINNLVANEVLCLEKSKVICVRILDFAKRFI